MKAEKTTLAPSPDVPFIVHAPSFEAATGTARFGYEIGPHRFTETLVWPKGYAPEAAASPAFERVLGLAAWVIGTSYYKLTAAFRLEAPELALSADETAFVRDVYENGLSEFYARNQLPRFGKLSFNTGSTSKPTPAPTLKKRALLPIGGGKDSLVSVQLLEAAGRDFTPFAVNAKGPILSSTDRIGKPALFVRRTLDPEMIALGKTPGFYNGHVPSTAIISLIAALTGLLFDYDTIILSNERSAEEGNIAFDGRTANHQHSKSLAFERQMAHTLAGATGGALHYFSLLRPYSEAHIGWIFSREDRFDHDFSSCNRNFKLAGHKGPMWCGACPKCHFTFLMLAPNMDRERLRSIFDGNLLDRPGNLAPYRELTGLSGHKPWECVGEILEAAAVLYALGQNLQWQEDAIVKTLTPELKAFYGAPALEAALEALHTPSAEHRVPKDLRIAMESHDH